ncbi:histone methylation protein DOT1-domain-containing protein [Copromyces sp. CBS 386.78]|nr:histone methylation protein DOT1-domain-containing protein [Copromyces sp. CBS 386.78]
MSIFNQKSKFKIKTEIRTVRETVERPKLKASTSSSSIPTTGSSQHSRNIRTAGAGSSLSRASSTSRLNGTSHTTSISSARASLTKVSTTSLPRRVQSASPNPSINGDGRSSRKRRATKASSRSPISPHFSEDSDSDSNGDENWEDNLDARKRRKRVHDERPVDVNRKLRHPKIWKGEDVDQVERIPGPGIIHAAKVASLEHKCKAALGLKNEEVAVRLQYPGVRYPERYELVEGKDKIDAVKDIEKVVQLVASIYLTDEEGKIFLDHQTGILRKLVKSKNRSDGLGFKAALREYNDELLKLMRRGVIVRNLDKMHGIPRELVDFILDQVYDRTVAPRVELLAKYQNGSDNVYGELNHPFISDILERTNLTSDKVFVDLGSGVGNVTLQAALEIGCESWGCEMMENACNLAEAQYDEFLARCRLWGIKSGKVRLERGDFRKNEKILEVLKRADVVLVNNQAFTSQLNDNLVSMFLDLKIGCKIISLKTFVHDNKNAENDVATSILDVEHLTYPEGYVSWTGASGTYCISTRR